MLPVPEIDRAGVVFGDIEHLPKWNDLDEEFRRNWSSNNFCEAISMWFYNGAKNIPNGIEINGVKFIAKAGVDSITALRAIKSVLGSWEPKHEHKIAGCGYMLSEWFNVSK